MMKPCRLFVVLFISSCISVKAETQANTSELITDPVTNFAVNNNLSDQDVIREVEVDLTGDGRKDLLLAYQDPNPDIVERQARKKEGNLLFWDTYIAEGDHHYVLSKGIEKNGELIAGAELPFRPDNVHLGKVLELAAPALVTFYIESAKRQPATISVVAYTWEGDHFKEHQLVEYPKGEHNPVFDEYLVISKRTALVVKEIKTPAAEGETDAKINPSPPKGNVSPPPSPTLTPSGPVKETWLQWTINKIGDAIPDWWLPAVVLMMVISLAILRIITRNIRR